MYETKILQKDMIDKKKFILRVLLQQDFSDRKACIERIERQVEELPAKVEKRVCISIITQGFAISFAIVNHMEDINSALKALWIYKKTINCLVYTKCKPKTLKEIPKHVNAVIIQKENTILIRNKNQRLVDIDTIDEDFGYEYRG